MHSQPRGLRPKQLKDSFRALTHHGSSRTEQESTNQPGVLGAGGVPGLGKCCGCVARLPQGWGVRKRRGILSFILASAATSAGVELLQGALRAGQVLLPCSPVGLSMDLELILFPAKCWSGTDDSAASVTAVPGITCSVPKY